MSWDRPGYEDARARRVWLVSPAIATVLFFGAQFLLAGYGDTPSSVRGAAADTPSAIPVSVRVVAEIKSAGDMKPAARVPASESELLELFHKQGAVVFSQSEVENIGTQSSEFDDQEVEVITADKHRRTARFRP
jgi:hypothetical protein